MYLKPSRMLFWNYDMLLRDAMMLWDWLGFWLNIGIYIAYLLRLDETSHIDWYRITDVPKLASRHDEGIPKDSRSYIDVKRLLDPNSTSKREFQCSKANREIATVLKWYKINQNMGLTWFTYCSKIDNVLRTWDLHSLSVALRLT